MEALTDPQPAVMAAGAVLRRHRPALDSARARKFLPAFPDSHKSPKCAESPQNTCPHLHTKRHVPSKSWRRTVTPQSHPKSLLSAPRERARAPRARASPILPCKQPDPGRKGGQFGQKNKLCLIERSRRADPDRVPIHLCL